MVSGALISMYVSVEKWGRKDYEHEFSGCDWNDTVANAEEEHIKATDQGAELNFLLDELRSLHRPTLSVFFLFWLASVETDANVAVLTEIRSEACI